MAGWGLNTRCLHSKPRLLRKPEQETSKLRVQREKAEQAEGIGPPCWRPGSQLPWPEAEICPMQGCFPRAQEKCWGTQGPGALPAYTCFYRLKGSVVQDNRQS